MTCHSDFIICSYKSNRLLGTFHANNEIGEKYNNSNTIDKKLLLYELSFIISKKIKIKCIIVENKNIFKKI